MPKMESLEISPLLEDHEAGLDTTFLRATGEPGMHLTLNAKFDALMATALINLGTMGIFIHPKFAKECNAIQRPKDIPREVRMIDGRVISSKLITHEATIKMTIGDHEEILVADITNTGKYPCILGIPWLTSHDPTIWWAQQRALFDSSYC